MLDEAFVLTYTRQALVDMSEDKRALFAGPIRKFVISTSEVRDTDEIRFNMYQDHFLEVVDKWPWLLCSDLGAHLEPSSWDEEITYNNVVNKPWRSIAYRQGTKKP